MAHKTGQGSTKNGRDSNPQYRGVKAYGGQFVTAGSMLVLVPAAIMFLLAQRYLVSGLTRGGVKG